MRSGSWRWPEGIRTYDDSSEISEPVATISVDSTGPACSSRTEEAGGNLWLAPYPSIKKPASDYTPYTWERFQNMGKKISFKSGG
jgi:hypothetical protein